MVSFTVQLGVSIEVADAKGCTPVIIASQYGRTMLVGYLIGKGACLTATDREGDTALHWAAFKGNRMTVLLSFDLMLRFISSQATALHFRALTMLVG